MTSNYNNSLTLTKTAIIDDNKIINNCTNYQTDYKRPIT